MQFPSLNLFFFHFFLSAPYVLPFNVLNLSYMLNCKYQKINIKNNIRSYLRVSFKSRIFNFFFYSFHFHSFLLFYFTTFFISLTSFFSPFTSLLVLYLLIYKYSTIINFILLNQHLRDF